MAVRTAAVVVDVALTCAPATTAPDGSFTTPEMLPIGACPETKKAKNRAVAAKRSQSCGRSKVYPPYDDFFTGYSNSAGDGASSTYQTGISRETPPGRPGRPRLAPCRSRSKETPGESRRWKRRPAKTTASCP